MALILVVWGYWVALLSWSGFHQRVLSSPNLGLEFWLTLL